MKKPVVIGLAVVVLAVAVAGGYQWYRSRQDDGLTLYDNVGTRTMSLSFRVGRRAESLAVDEGDAIKTDQVLGELDHEPYEITLMQARAGVSMARAQYGLMLVGYRDKKITQAAATVEQTQAAYDYAQNFYNRQQRLQKSRTISANDLGSARSSRDQAQAMLKSAQNKLRQYRPDSREQDTAQAKASPEQAQAQPAQVELNLQDSTLVVLSDGTLLTRTVEPGTVLSEGGTVFTVSLTRPMWVHAYIDKRNLSQAQPGRKVLLYTDGRPDRPYHRQIGFVPPTAEFTPKTAGTSNLRADLIYRPRIVVTDADDALHQEVPVAVQFGDETGHG